MKQINIKKASAAIAEKPLLIWDYVIFAVIAAACFLLFQQTDLLHTAGCSYGYLNGHVLDFYDYCGEYGIHPSYMPTTYIMFAVWNIPMRLFRIAVIPTEDLRLIAVMWAKLLPCLIYLASGYVIYRICMECGMGSKKSKICVYASLTMPVAVYAQFIFGQYDIFMTFCVLMGVYCYLRKKDMGFVLWFAIAMTFKYSALLLFVPLLLLRIKNVWKILIYMILLMIPLALLVLIYRGSPAFADYAFGLGGSAGDNPTGYILNSGYFTGFELSQNRYTVSFAVLGFGAICAYAYFTDIKEKSKLPQWTFYLCCLSFFVLFGFAKWHPQWLLFAVPFWVISSFLHKDTRIFMILDLIFMLIYVIFNVQMVPGNVDQAMFNHGILGSLVNGNIGTELMMKDIIGKLDRSMCLSMLTMMMLVYAVFKHPRYCASDPLQEVNCMGWIRTRFIAGTAVFVVPAFMCLAAYFTAPDAGYNVRTFNSAAELKETGDKVSQTFCSTGNSIDRIQFVAGVNDRINEGCITLTVSDEKGNVLYTEDFGTSGWYEGELINTSTGGIVSIPGDYYTVTFEVTAAQGDYDISMYHTDSNITGDPDEISYFNGKEMDQQYMMTVYQKQ